MICVKQVFIHKYILKVRKQYCLVCLSQVCEKIYPLLLLRPCFLPGYWVTGGTSGSRLSKILYSYTVHVFLMSLLFSFLLLLLQHTVPSYFISHHTVILPSLCQSLHCLYFDSSWPNILYLPTFSLDLDLHHTAVK